MKLLHGDCLELMKKIPAKSIDMILCDLPYGTTACKWDIIIPFEPLWKQYNRVIKDRGCIALFGSEPFSSYLRMSNIKNYKYDWIWNKKNSGSGLLAKAQPLKICELISVFSYKSHNYYPQMTIGKMRNKKSYGSKKGSTTGEIKIGKNKFSNSYYPKHLLEFSNASQKNKFHPTQKPVALLEYLIKTYTLEGKTVLDNCMGSGSTGVACVNTNRDFIGIEKDKTYFDIARTRIKEAQAGHK